MRAGLSHRLRTRSMVEDRTVEPYRVAITRGHAEPQAAVAGAGPDRRPVAGAEAEAEGQAAGRMPRQAPLESRRQSARRYGVFWQCQTSVFSKLCNSYNRQSESLQRSVQPRTRGTAGGGGGGGGG